MYICVCICNTYTQEFTAIKGFLEAAIENWKFNLSGLVCLCVCVCVYVCVCVCFFLYGYIYIYTHIYIYRYVYIYNIHISEVPYICSIKIKDVIINI